MFPAASSSGLRSASARVFAIPAARPWVKPPPSLLLDKKLPTLQPRSRALTAAGLAKRMPSGCGISPRSAVSLAHTSCVRYAHTDATQVPDFNKYRRESSRAADKHSTADSRKLFSYAVGVGAASVATVYASKAFVRDLLSYFGPAADVLALAKVEVKLSDIPEGKSTVVKWRGKPLFIRHRTAAEIEQERNVDVATLRHPETDAERAQRPEWLVLLGVCTHLGCVPIPYVGEYRGYFCPCHGSVYDASGRIRSGPAPTNLEVPKHEFIDDNTVVVG